MQMINKIKIVDVWKSNGFFELKNFLRKVFKIPKKLAVDHTVV